MGAGARSTCSTVNVGKQFKVKLLAPAYMAPEQAGGLINEVDARSDVYLGAILYHLLPTAAFHGQIKSRNRKSSLKEDVIPSEPHTIGFRGLEAICQKGLSPCPNKRYQTAEELGDAIQEYLDKPSISVMPAQTDEIGRWVLNGRKALEKEGKLTRRCDHCTHNRNGAASSTSQHSHQESRSP